MDKYGTTVSTRKLINVHITKTHGIPQQTKTIPGRHNLRNKNIIYNANHITTSIIPQRTGNDISSRDLDLPLPVNKDNIGQFYQIATIRSRIIEGQFMISMSIPLLTTEVKAAKIEIKSPISIK